MPVAQEFIESLMKQNQMLLEQNNTLIEQVDSLSKTIDELNATIKELREQLNKNSGNSSKPPLSDGFKKAPKSLREKSGKKCGYEGIKSVGVLPDYRGIIVHDCWASYWKFDGVTHSVCCAHLLRELNGIIENHPEQVWAGKFKKLLLRMKKAKNKAVAAGKEALSMFTIQNYKREYNNIIKDAYGENPEPVKPKKKRGRVKRGKILALIDRLQKYKGAVCLFLEKLGVPFDNNQAERDIRNIKTKTKVCGCFRRRTGAEEYMGLMSFISTARKNGFDSYHAVKMALSCQTDQIFVGWL